ncbi:hypothetical protein [Pseudomonas sp. S9]|uniref:hypothetical protein n=1 Tax=Pseudomonas sp. S9 TaxID=686578 RepID=UPI00025572E9|nr:hypothetical protein [Pseudomonas sp. S9]
MPLHKDFLLKTPATSKPETNKPRTARSGNQKKLGPAQLAAIAAIQGQAEADRIQALLAGDVVPEAIKHLDDVSAPEYALVAKFITPDAKPKLADLEKQIAAWALEHPEMVK